MIINNFLLRYNNKIQGEQNFVLQKRWELYTRFQCYISIIYVTRSSGHPVHATGTMEVQPLRRRRDVRREIILILYYLVLI